MPGTIMHCDIPKFEASTSELSTVTGEMQQPTPKRPHWIERFVPPGVFILSHTKRARGVCNSAPSHVLLTLIARKTTAHTMPS